MKCQTKKIKLDKLEDMKLEVCTEVSKDTIRFPKDTEYCKKMRCFYLRSAIVKDKPGGWYYRK